MKFKAIIDTSHLSMVAQISQVGEINNQSGGNNIQSKDHRRIPQKTRSPKMMKKETTDIQRPDVKRPKPDFMK